MGLLQASVACCLSTRRDAVDYSACITRYVAVAHTDKRYKYNLMKGNIRMVRGQALSLAEVKEGRPPWAALL
jgi:hypothetical protein